MPTLTTTARRAMLLALVAASSAVAQSTTPTTAPADSGGWLRRGSASLSFVQGRPQGAFARNVGHGYGVDGTYQLRLDDAGVWSLRASIGALSYGDESRRAALSETVGGRVQVDVTTTNYLIPVSIGPQVTWPTGAVRPYANVGIGGIGFLTESSVRGTNELTPLASTTNHSDFTGAWVLGGGVYVPLTVRSRQLAIDLGVQYVNGGRARYLAPGSIAELPGAQVSVTPLESATHAAIVRLGVRLQ